jgi:hypothetical protein
MSDAIIDFDRSSAIVCCKWVLSSKITLVMPVKVRVTVRVEIRVTVKVMVMRRNEEVFDRSNEC